MSIYRARGVMSPSRMFGLGEVTAAQQFIPVTEPVAHDDDTVAAELCGIGPESTTGEGLAR
jgi:hypothetical protein